MSHILALTLLYGDDEKLVIGNSEGATDHESVQFGPDGYLMGMRVWQNIEKDTKIRGIQFMYYNKPLPTEDAKGNEFGIESKLESGKSLEPESNAQNYEQAIMMDKENEEMNPDNFAKDNAFGDAATFTGKVDTIPKGIDPIFEQQEEEEKVPL